MDLELKAIINDIVKYGLQPKLNVVNKEIELEENLIKIHLLQFGIDNINVEKDYPDFDRSIPNLFENIKSNFPKFGYYKVIENINNLTVWDDLGMGDAIDDLQDIILDLLEIKWRIDNNSLEDGLWHFKFLFKNHTQQHILDLINYIRNNHI